MDNIVRFSAGNTFTASNGSQCDSPVMWSMVSTGSPTLRSSYRFHPFAVIISTDSSVQKRLVPGTVT